MVCWAAESFATSLTPETELERITLLLSLSRRVFIYSPVNSYTFVYYQMALLSVSGRILPGMRLREAAL